MSSGIDARLNRLIDSYNTNKISRLRKDEVINGIIAWKWHGSPGPLSTNSTVEAALDLRVLSDIRMATLEECAASKSEYVRECKLWIIHNSKWLYDWLTPSAGEEKNG